MQHQHMDFKPTRLLQIVRSGDHPKVKLVHTAQISGGTITYATLSHCWGSTLAARLLKHLINDYSTDIPWKSLPQTFQDAVITSVKLDIGYLWIDALCIIQDDNDDWNYEAARMTGVYANSYINISADASHDGTEGLFRQRNPTPLQSFVAPHAKEGHSRCSSVFYTDRWWSSVCHGPLANRAWTVQETFLAPRGLHFAAEEVHWECMELFTAESLPVLFNNTPATGYIIRKSALKLDILGQERTELLYSIWYQLVAAYSSGSLTFTSDRAIAIAGLAGMFCHLLGLSESDYLCGMWRPLLEHDLMWQRHVDWWTPPQNLRISNLPSWSWLSLCTGIWMHPRDLVGDMITAEVTHASTTPCYSAFGPVSAGQVSIRAPLCRVTMRKGNDPFYDGRHKYDHIIDISGSILREEEHFEFRPDDDSISGMSHILDTPVYLMLGRALRSKRDKILVRLETDSPYETLSTPSITLVC